MAASYVIDFTVGWSFGEPQASRTRATESAKVILWAQYLTGS